jgi:hypothetical protein
MNNLPLQLNYRNNNLMNKVNKTVHLHINHSLKDGKLIAFTVENLFLLRLRTQLTNMHNQSNSKLFRIVMLK